MTLLAFIPILIRHRSTHNGQNEIQRIRPLVIAGTFNPLLDAEQCSTVSFNSFAIACRTFRLLFHERGVVVMLARHICYTAYITGPRAVH